MLERGLPPPKWYGEEPDMLPLHEFYMRAFWALSTERQIGFTLGPIPESKIVEYGARAELDCDIIPVYIETIRALDRTFMDWAADKRKRDKEMQGKK